MKRHLKQPVISMLAAVLTAVMLICSISALRVRAEDRSIIVFAAASLTEPLEELAELYKASDPEREIIFNFDSSGTLKKQIVEGADCDLFISASSREMDELDATQNSKEEIQESLDYIISDTRNNLLENKLVLIASEDEPEVKSFEELTEAISDDDTAFLLAIGNSDVPAGRYAVEVLENLGLTEDILISKGIVTFGSTVKEMVTQVKEAAVDYAIVYKTDAVSAGLEVIDIAEEELCSRILYPAAVLKNSLAADEAAEFLGFLKSDEAAEVFEKSGFTVISKGK